MGRHFDITVDYEDVDESGILVERGWQQFRLSSTFLSGPPHGRVFETNCAGELGVWYGVDPKLVGTILIDPQPGRWRRPKRLADAPPTAEKSPEDIEKWRQVRFFFGGTWSSGPR